MAETKVTDDLYFASPERAPEDVAVSVIEKIEDEKERRSYLLRRWHRNYCYYHNMYFDSSVEYTEDNVFFTGSQGESIAVAVNHYGNFIDHMVNLIASDRPSFTALAQNGDHKSRMQAKVADSVLEYEIFARQLEDKFRHSAQTSILMDSGYVYVWWNPTAGDVIGWDEGDAIFEDRQSEKSKPIFEGEPVVESHLPKDVFYDDSYRTFEENPWIAIRRYRNKYDLMATFPEQAEAIKQSLRARDEQNGVSAYGEEDAADKIDVLEVFEFFHKPSPSVPEGRYMLLTVDGVVLLDHELEVGELPVVAMPAGVDLMHQHGYSPANNLSTIQTLLNAEYSAIASNHDNLGQPVILVHEEADVAVEELEEAFNIVKFAGTLPPTTLNLMQDDGQNLRFIEKLIQDMETLSGINSVVRGQLQSHQMAGVSIALMQEQAIQFWSYFQNSYIRMIEKVGRLLLKMYQTYSANSRVIKITGLSNQQAVTEFTGQDISDVEHVKVEFGNRLSKTLSGRITLAEYAIKATGQTLDPKDMLEVIQTGSLDFLWNAATSAQEVAEQENEWLMAGRRPVVSMTDDHRQHIIKHVALIDQNPEARLDSNPILAETLAHIQAHMDMLNNPQFQQLYALLGHSQGAVPPQAPAPQGPPAGPVQGLPKELQQNLGDQRVQVKPVEMPTPYNNPQG